MPIKTNDSTINRPDGKRLIDAPAVMVDIEEYIDQLKDESAWKKNDRNAITVFKTPGLTLVLSAFHKDAEINDLQLEGVVILQVVEGSITVCDPNNETVTLEKKQLLVLHPEHNHKLVAEKDTIVLLTALKESSLAV